MNSITDPQSQSSYTMANPHINAVESKSIGDPDYNQRILPRQLSTGALRGTQHVGYGDVKIDGSNNQIVIGKVTDSLGEQAQTVIGDLTPNNLADKSFGLRVTDATGTSVTYGLLSDGTPGMQITDSSGFVLFKLTGKTWYWYDKNFGTNTMQAGLLPNGDYGWVATPPANNVTDAFES